MKEELKSTGARIRGGFSVLALAAALTAIDGGASMASAQSTEGEPAAEGAADSIYVTASRRKQSVEDVPYNISAISGDDLNAARVTDFSKLTRSIPGLQLTDRGIRDNSTSARLISRGLNTESAAIADLPFVTASPVATYVDETPVFVNLRLNDIERVEFLRGPQGTLYGSGSLGGTLRFIQNKPDASGFSAKAEAGVSFTNDAGGPNYTVSGMVNAPIGENAALRVSGGHDFYHGFIDGLGRAIIGADGLPAPSDPGDPINSAPATEAVKDINDADVSYLHAALRVTPNDIWDIQLSYHYQREQGDNRDAQSATPGIPQRKVTTLLDEPSTRELHLGSLDIEVDFGFAALTSSTSYYQTTTEAIGDGTGIYGTLGYLFTPRITARSNLDSRKSAVVQEARLVSNSDGPVDWIIGVYYQNEDSIELNEHDYFLGDGLIGNPVTDPTDLFLHLRRTSDFSDLAGFGELTYHVTDRWQVTGGFRAFKQKFDSFSFFNFPAFGFYPGDPNSFKDSDVLFKANTSYEVNDAATVYATFSQGFRRGGANSIPTSGPLAEPAGLISYAADRVNNYEIGVKGRFDSGIRYSAALYYIDWSDAQIGTLSPVFGYDVAVNGGDATGKGAEFELSGPLTDDLEFSFGYAYTDAHLEEGFSGYVSGAPDARLPGVSKHALSGSLDYSRAVSADLDFLAHIDGSYRSKFVNSVDPGADIYREFEGFPLIGASLSLASERWRVSLYAENLFDELGLSAQNDPVENGSLYHVEWGVRPRTIGLMLSAEY